MLLGKEILFSSKKNKAVTLPYLIFNAQGARNGSRYFDTGIIPGPTTRVELLMGRNSSAALNVGWQTGCRSGWVSNALMLNYTPIPGRCWLIYNNGTYDINVKPVDSSFSAVYVSFGANGILEAGDVVLNTGQNLSLANNSLYIGDVNENGTPKGGTDSQGSAKMFWCKIYEGNTLVKHYLPAQQSGAPVLHELVADAYLQSEGSFGVSSIVYGEETVTLVNGGKIEMETALI
ncbi:MAG: hypothetical protein J6Q22_10935 [Prevotella sp.]|nr:hypothetical protein [Prevotella sp.]